MQKKYLEIVNKADVLIFDFDGTIAATNQTKINAFNNAIQKMGISENNCAHFMRVVKEYFGLTTRQGICEEFIRQSALELDAEFTIRSCELYAECLEDTYDHASLIPGFSQFIEDANCTQNIIVSGGNQIEIEKYLQIHSLDKKFDLILDGSCSKRFHYETLDQKLGFGVTTVVFGDTLEDFTCSKIIGADFFFVSYESHTLDDRHLEKMHLLNASNIHIINDYSVF